LCFITKQKIKLKKGQNNKLDLMNRVRIPFVVRSMLESGYFLTLRLLTRCVATHPPTRSLEPW
jgi:hypothetical protein